MKEHIERIEEAATKAFDGVLVDYHRELGLRLCKAIADGVPESALENTLRNICYAKGSINSLIEEDEERNRHGEHR